MKRVELYLTVFFTLFYLFRSDFPLCDRDRNEDEKAASCTVSLGYLSIIHLEADTVDRVHGDNRPFLVSRSVFCSRAISTIGHSRIWVIANLFLSIFYALFISIYLKMVLLLIFWPLLWLCWFHIARISCQSSTYGIHPSNLLVIVVYNSFFSYPAWVQTHGSSATRGIRISVQKSNFLVKEH